MKKLFSSPDIVLIGLYKSILENNNIAILVKNYYLTSGVGDLPPNECVPELWVIDDDKLEEAKTLLKDDSQSSWQCTCGEKISGHFAQCWKCNKLRK